MTATSTNRPAAASATALALALATTLGLLPGCGPRMYPVRGTVTLADGAPLKKGLLVFERVAGGPPVTARGNLNPDGSYELSTETPGDGVPPGTYRGSINPLDTSDVPDELKVLPFDRKYLNQATSGLEFQVPGAGGGGYDIKLTHSAGGGAPTAGVKR